MLGRRYFSELRGRTQRVHITQQTPPLHSDTSSLSSSMLSASQPRERSSRFVAAGTFPRFLKAASERMRSLRQRSKQLLGARTE